MTARILPFRREPDTYRSTSLRPIADDAIDLVACLAAEWAQNDGRLPRLAVLKDRIVSAIRRCRGAIAIAVDTDLFFIATGALVAADLCLVIYLAGGGR